MKQMAAAKEMVRSNEIIELKNSIKSIKQCVTELNSEMSKDLCKIKLSIERLESESISGITCLKKEAKQVKESVRSMEENFDLLCNSVKL